MNEHSRNEFHTKIANSYDSFFQEFGFNFDDRKYQGFANLGYFDLKTESLSQASENMMEHLLGLVHRHQGSVLDIGCGLGGTTRYLTNYYSPEKIHGVNISAYQLEECRSRAPGCNFYLMPAEALTFPDNSFDTVISVEAACHFQGRREFLSEAMRVLKPGGELVVADILFHSQPTTFPKMLSGQEIYNSLDEYLMLWQSCGFNEVTIKDVTRECWSGFSNYINGVLIRRVLDRNIDALTFQRLLKFSRKIAQLPVSFYVFAHAAKPVYEI
jgi:MPBQ/MSBQ methyltransferase